MRSARAARTLIQSLNAASETCALQPAQHINAVSSQLLDRILFAKQPRGHASAAEAATEDATSDIIASEGSDQSRNTDVLKSLLAQFIPHDDMKQLYKYDGQDRLRFGDLPATHKLMDSFYASRLPGEPLYDLPTWLEHNYPKYDTQPRSSLYHWVTWMRDNLPLPQQRLYLAFDEYMQSEKHRAAIVAQANYELARLWDWQHRRAANGLPPELTEEEVAHLSQAAALVAEAEKQVVQAKIDASKSLEDVLEEGLREMDKKEASVVPPVESLPLPNILRIIQKAEAPEEAVVEASGPTAKAQKPAAVKLGPDLGIRDLTSEQREFLSKMTRPGPQVRELASSFEQRIQGGQKITKFQNRVRDALTAESHERASLEAELEVLGMDPSAANDASLLHALYGSGSTGSTGSTVAAAQRKSLQLQQSKAFEKELQPMLGADLARASKGKQYWNQTSVLNYRANLEKLQQREAELAAMMVNAKQDEARLLSSIQSQGYEFAINVRPPTKTLDLMTDYLQIKYQDAALQKDACNSIMAGVQERQQATLASSASAQALSPPELSSINRQADEMFEAIRAAPSASLGAATKSYISFVEQLHMQGIISQAILRECVAAARLRSAHVGAAAAEAADSSAAVSDADRDALLAAMTGTSPAGRALPQSAGGSSELEAARQLWDTASQGAAFSTWAKLMQKFTTEDIARRREAGDDIPDSLEAELMSWWAQPSTFDDARALWSSYLEAAGRGSSTLACSHSGVGPFLEEVLLADSQSRDGKQPALLEAQLKDLYLSYSAHHGSTMGSSTAGGTAAAPANTSMVPPSWSDVQTHNGAIDLISASSLSSTFRSASLISVLRGHWNSVCQRFGIAQPSDPNFTMKQAATVAAPASWDDLWQLMELTYKKVQKEAAQKVEAQERASSGSSSSDSTASVPSSSSSSSIAGSIAGIAGSTAGIAGSSSSIAGSIAGSSSSSSIAGSGDTSEHSSTAAASSSSWEAYREAMSQHGVESSSSIQPPYPGAHQLVRFRQAIVLDAASATSDHPVNRRVEMRVNVTELQRETGLSKGAMMHILRVAGRRRFDPDTRELVILGLRYPSREENRRWCLERLHLLLQEGYRRHPSGGNASVVVPMLGLQSSLHL